MNHMLDPKSLAADVRLAQQNDPNAMNRILTAVQDMVYYSCLRMLQDDQTAQDASQDVLITIYRRIGSLADPMAYLGWVKRIIANRCKEILSKNNKEFLLSEDEDGADPLARVEDLDEQRVPDKALDNAETQRMILDLVDRLPDEQRMCVMLYYYNEMKTREIAEALNISEGTVKSRLNYARKAIKEGVNEYEKKGIKLYGLSPLLFLTYFLRAQGSATLTPFTVSIPGASAAATGASAAKTASGASASAAKPSPFGTTSGAAARGTGNAATADATNGAGSAAAGTAAAGKTAASSGFAAFLATTAGKIVAAVTIAVVLGGAITGTVFAVKGAKNASSRSGSHGRPTHASVVDTTPEPVNAMPVENPPYDPNEERPAPETPYNSQEWLVDPAPESEPTPETAAEPESVPATPTQQQTAAHTYPPRYRTISTDAYEHYALADDGTILGYDDANGIFTSEDNLVSIHAILDFGIDCLNTYVLGLRADGTVEIDSTAEHSGALRKWTDIVEIAVGPNHVLGRRSDGTVVAVYTGNGHPFDTCNVSEWTDIVAIAAGYHSVGLKSDGTVVVAGDYDGESIGIEDWTDIIAITAGEHYTAGLKRDGTVVLCGIYTWMMDCSDWTDIVAISAGDDHLLGLKRDGTVVMTYMQHLDSSTVSEYKGRDYSDWTDIVAIYADESFDIGLRADGTAVTASVGNSKYAKWYVYQWTNIRLP